MKNGLKIAKALVWLTQLGLSVAIPPCLCIAGSVWLRDSFGLGGWIVAVGVALGVLGAGGGLISSLRTVRLLSGEEDSPKQRPPAYNDHE